MVGREEEAFGGVIRGRCVAASKPIDRQPESCTNLNFGDGGGKMSCKKASSIIAEQTMVLGKHLLDDRTGQGPG